MVETIDLVPHWKWHQGSGEIGATATLSCHNKSLKSIFVTKIGFVTKGFFFYFDGAKGIYFGSPTENPLPQQIKPDETFAFRIDVSSAVQSIDFSKRRLSWLYKADRHSLWIRLTTASGNFEEIRAREFIPPDALEKYIKLGKTNAGI